MSIPFIADTRDYYPEVILPYLDRGGEAKGYVAIPTSLAKDEKTMGILIDTDVHGGCTFAQTFKGKFSDIIENWQLPVEALTEYDDGEDYFIVGFDTMHYGDTPAVWTKEAVKQETLRWAIDIAKTLGNE